MAECKLCYGTGYYDKEVNGNITTYRCKCYNKIQAKRYLQNSGLGELLNNTVSDFETKHRHQRLMKDMAIEYVTSNSKDWFVMLGASGSGKSHLCSAVAKTFIEKGIETKYIVWTSFTKELNALMFQGDKADARALNVYKEVPVLYIDDFLKGRTTEYNITMAFDLLNYRVINNLTTIISSEYTMEELLNIDEAVAGRINHKGGNYVMEVPKGKHTNYRLENRKIRIAV